MQRKSPSLTLRNVVPFVTIPLPPRMSIVTYKPAMFRRPPRALDTTLQALEEFVLSSII